MGQFCRLEQLAEGGTCIHRLHPLAKLLMTAVFLGAVISFPVHALSGLAPMTLYIVLGMALSETPWKPILLRLLTAAPFVAVTGLCNLLLDRAPLFFLGPVSVSGGVLSCLSILGKGFLTVSAVLLLVSTTSLLELSNQLARCHAPRMLCLQLILTYRYISVLLGEAGQMVTAYRLRSGRDGGIRMADMGCFLGQLLLRSYDRAERVYCAMKCRGYDGTYRPDAGAVWTFRDTAATVTVCSGILLARSVNFSLLLGGLF